MSEVACFILALLCLYRVYTTAALKEKLEEREIEIVQLKRNIDIVNSLVDFHIKISQLPEVPKARRFEIQIPKSIPFYELSKLVAHALRRNFPDGISDD